MPKLNKGQLLAIAIGVVGIGAALFAWQSLQKKDLPDGFASGNGRIEAVEIDIAAKTAGRIEEILVDEGDFVTAGQVLAKMDTAVLEAQRREARARLRQAQNAIETARSQVTQRQSERAAGQAVVVQHQAEVEAAKRRLARSEALLTDQAIAAQQVDDDRTAFLSARAAFRAAEAEVVAADAAIVTARSQVIGAESDVEAAQAALERIEADLDDSVLKSPREGRVQYRVAQPGEVLASGGTVLNMIDLTDVYMTFFLPTKAAGRVALGTEARLVLDAAPQYVVPAEISFVADEAQFTPKTVETTEERLKLMFRVKARIDPALLRRHLRQVKTGLPGMAYVRFDSTVDWPPELQTRLPQ
ncbi:MAG: HlyD family efflux transporter periplasmic adaptor subunit [Desulfuromonadales bacterium]|nr:HlyD family efflux transporter periplasmic adaptor subunit [Desulfuromonadales bacterium]